MKASSSRHLIGRGLLTVLILGALTSSLLPGTATAEDEESASSQPLAVKAPDAAASTAEGVAAYWTAERMDAAVPYPMPEVVEDESTSNAAADTFHGLPGAVNGSPPANDPEAAPASEPSFSGAGLVGHHYHASTSYPPPFQRWTLWGKYTVFPVSTIGKMFFSQDHDANGSASNFVCSFSVLQIDRVATAGHCLSNGLNGAGVFGGFSFNISFCPGFNASGAVRGCWGTNGSDYGVTGEWFANGNVDRDLGGAETAPTGSVFGTEIGNVTGWLGRAWNFAAESNTSFGYPAAAPFPGTRIFICASTTWYTINWGVGADSKYIGCDKTGGTSGGPWILGLGHGNSAVEVPPVGGVNASTGEGNPDPGGGNWLNGVNSHRRISGLCNPTLCNHELASMPFTTEAGGSEDFFVNFLFVI